MRYEFPSVVAMPLGFWKWPHFHPQNEWADKASGRIVVQTEFMDLLEQIRMQCAFPLPINSGYRTPEHNAQVSFTGDDGPHTTGFAADIRIYGERSFRLVDVAIDYGVTGIGIAQKGDVAGRYIHIDILPPGDPAAPRPRLWSY